MSLPIQRYKFKNYLVNGRLCELLFFQYLKKLGIDSEEEQKNVLEFLYSVGIIVLNQGK